MMFTFYSSFKMAACCISLLTKISRVLYAFNTKYNVIDNMAMTIEFGQLLYNFTF